MNIKILKKVLVKNLNYFKKKIGGKNKNLKKKLKAICKEIE